jgi:SH3-like domain-containing protein
MKTSLRFTFATLVLSVLLPLAAKAEAVCVQTKTAILRKGPATTFPITWTVGQNMPFLRVSEKGGWSEVKDLDGQVHWVNSRVLSAKFQCGVVKARQAKLRRGNATKQPASLELADRYTPFRKVDRDGAQILVQDEYKAEYWIAEAALWSPVTRTQVAF